MSVHSQNAEPSADSDRLVLDAGGEDTFLLAAILDHLPDMVFVKDASKLRFVYMNPAGETLLGFPVSDFLGKTDHDFFPEDEAEYFIRRDRETLRSGTVLDIQEEPIRTRNGSIRYLQTKKIPILDEQGAPRYLLGIARDITELKRGREAQLQFFANAPDLLCIVDFDGTVRAVNPTLQQALGYTEKESLGRSFLHWVHPHDGKPALGALQQLRAGAERADVTLRFLHKDGRYRWMSVRAVADLGSRTIYASAQDVTEQIKLEQQLVEITTLEQERLARELHDSLAQTLTGLALKATVVQDALETGRDLPRMPLQQIVELANHASRQARAVARGLDPIMHRDGLVAALRDLAASTEETFDIRCVFATTDPCLLPDKQVAAQLYRIAQEALTNVVRHAAARQITVSLVPEDGSLVLSVTDDGVGLADQAERIEGRGMRNMRYRARMIGAVLDFHRNVQGGTTVHCRYSVPCADGERT